MSLRDRNRCQVEPPDCPMGSDGPFLSDPMMDFAESLVDTMCHAVAHSGQIVVSHEGGDISGKAFGGIVYVHAMGAYIREIEAELRRTPLIGLKPSDLVGNIIATTDDRISFEDGRVLVRTGIHWAADISRRDGGTMSTTILAVVHPGGEWSVLEWRKTAADVFRLAAVAAARGCNLVEYAIPDTGIAYVCDPARCRPVDLVIDK